MFLELTDTQLPSRSHWTPYPKPSKKGNFRDWSLTVPAIFIITHTRDGGTLRGQVTGCCVREPGSSPIVARLMFQD